MIRLIQADLTTLAVDAIVNAANETLLGGGGVDGAIHHAAGPELLAACRALPLLSPGVRCPTGEARITPGFRLAAHYVIHCVGPIWHDGNDNEAAQLAACYRDALQLAQAWDLKSIAFPAISCGAYGYPPQLAVVIALKTLQPYATSLQITLCCFASPMMDNYCNAAREIDIELVET